MVYLVDYIFSQAEIGAVVAGKIRLGYLQKILLIAAVGKIQPQIYQISNAALRVALNVCQRFFIVVRIRAFVILSLLKPNSTVRYLLKNGTVFYRLHLL